MKPKRQQKPNSKQKQSDMFVLDSDTTLFFNGSQKVVQRVLAAPDDAIYLPAIVVEEQR